MGFSVYSSWLTAHRLELIGLSKRLAPVESPDSEAAEGHIQQGREAGRL